jgi:hypothetical protein
MYLNVEIMKNRHFIPVYSPAQAEAMDSFRYEVRQNISENYRQCTSLQSWQVAQNIVSFYQLCNNLAILKFAPSFEKFANWAPISEIGVHVISRCTIILPNFEMKFRFVRIGPERGVLGFS